MGFKHCPLKTTDNRKSKCHSLHIGKPTKYCPGMKVHGHPADRVAEAMYLGDLISVDGRNTSNIKSKVNKGLGLVTQIMDILKSISFGNRFFEIAVTLREAILINGMLTNSEIWYSLRKTEIAELEEVDKLLLRRVIEAPTSACIESVFF